MPFRDEANCEASSNWNVKDAGSRHAGKDEGTLETMTRRAPHGVYLAIFALACLVAFIGPERTRADSAAMGETTTRDLKFETVIEGRKIPDYIRSLLEQTITLGKDGVPPPLSVGQLRRRAIEDEDLLEKVLRSEAYYKGRISSSLREGAGGTFEVVYTVRMGPRTMIDSFDIVYEDKPEDMATLPATGAALGLKKGLAAKAQRIIDLTDDAMRYLENNGHPGTSLIKRDVIVDMAADLAHVTLHIKAGPRLVFGPMLVQNPDGRTKDDYVRSFATFKAGDAYSKAQSEETVSALRGAGLFDSVTMSSGDVTNGDELPQNVTLKESKPRSIRLGTRWASDTGFGVTGSWEHRNLWGEGEDLLFGSIISQTEQSLSANFKKPRFRQDNQTLLAGFEIAREKSDAYDENRVKVSAALSRQETKKLALSAGLSFELTRTADERGNNHYQLFGLPLVARYDGSNDLFDPTSGMRASLAATPYLGRSNEKASAFGKLEGIASGYWSFGERPDVTLALRGRLGSILARETDEVPGSTRFYAGGGGSIRGYAYQSVGPLDSSNDPVGGRSVFETNAEIRYRATETIGVVAFVDAGDSYSASLPSFSSPLQVGAGLGLRYYTPIGPVRLDVGVPVNPRDGIDDAFQLYVSLGQSF